jgi:hypothetical protein
MIGTTRGHYRITAPIGAGGPPSLTARFARSYGASAVAMERTCW